MATTFGKHRPHQARFEVLIRTPDDFQNLTETSVSVITFS